MTLLLAVLTDDAVLVAADCKSTAYESDPTFWQPFPAVVENEKFLPTGARNLMWAFAGFDRVAEPLFEWAKKGTWASWPALVEDAKKKSDKAVRRGKQFVTARQGNPDDARLLLGTMFCGYVGGKPGLLVVNTLGFPCTIEEHNVPIPFGGGETIALAAWNVLSAFHPDKKITTPQELADFTNSVCDSVAGLEAPADVWKITKDDHEKCEVIHRKPSLGG